MVIVEKQAGDFTQRYIVNGGSIYSTLNSGDIEMTRVDISIMYSLFFNNNFNDVFSRNPDLHVAKSLVNMNLGEIVFNDSKFVMSDIRTDE